METNGQQMCFFAVLGRERDWKPLAGHEPPSAKVYEVRALPGRLYAAGASREEAQRNLEVVMERAADGEMARWYECALADLSHSERDALGEVAMNAVRNLARVMEINLHHTKVGFANMDDQLMAGC